MFDFFLLTHFKPTWPVPYEISFSDLPFYDQFESIEYKIKLKNSFICYLERSPSDQNVFSENSKHYFIYGSVFTNKKYEGERGRKPFKLRAEDLFSLIQKYDLEVVHYLKGSFVIVILDESKKNLSIITDRLNVLPLYYSYDHSTLVLSSSMKMLFKSGLVQPEINYFSLTEQLMFDYVLGEKCLYKNVTQTAPGAIISIDVDGVRKTEYWSVDQLYHDKLMGRREGLECLSRQLYDNVNLYAHDSQKVLVSFTGGFDGRTNVALLDRPVQDYLCYSYGMPGSEQLEIPQRICKKLGINFQPVFLDQEFEKNHNRYAKMASEFSHGSAPILRANYPYAFSKLSVFSNVVITGLFGSEILRPIYNMGIMINDYSERLFLSGKIENSISIAISDITEKNYIRNMILEESKEYLIQLFKKEYFEKYKDFDHITRFFFFILKEGIRKYFMQEIQIERTMVTNRFPYFDDDLIDLIYQTPLAGMYNGILGKSKFKRRKGQLLYAYILKHYDPSLGSMELDRGYCPNDLLKPFPFNYLTILRGVRKSKKYIKMRGNDTFNPKKWTRPTIREILKEKSLPPGFERGILDDFDNGDYLTDLLTYSHLISFIYYYSTL